jgi:hypothetical protein
MIRVDPEFRDFIPPLAPAERAALEAAIIAAGRATTPIDVWGLVIVDGHNRYEICSRLGLPYSVRELQFVDRAAAKEWIFANQIARRNLTTDQVVMLAAMRGVKTTRGSARQHAQATALAGAGKGGPVLSGKWSLAVAYGAHARESGLVEKKPYTPRGARPPQGPATKPHPIPEGHQLNGLSTLTDLQTGEPKAEWAKTGIAGAEHPPVAIPESFLLDRTSVMQRGDGTTSIQWSSYSREKQAQWDEIKAAVVAHVTEHVHPIAPVDPPRAEITDDLLVCYPLGDPHIGMLAWAAEVGESFDLSIAKRELCECMRQLVARSPKSKRAIVANLGDFWHAEDDRQATPKSGHKLDVDGRAGKVGRVGLAILTTLVETALTHHEQVVLRNIPGNHDPHSSFWLPEIMRATYRNDPRVVVEDGFNPYQFDVHGKCLLGWAHGDGAKIEALGEIMATDVPDLWGAASFRFWNVGHVHHLSEKELRGCVVNTHRTLAGRDAWHHHSGYRSGRSLKAIAYHKDWGLDSVAVVGVERVRAALGVGK